MAETPEQKYNRIAAAVRQTILNEFPNPNRVGCPGDAKLRDVAARRTIVEDDDWQHITHCSPCYAEYLAVKEESRRAGRRARILKLIGGTTVALALAGLLGYEYLGKPKASGPIVASALEAATLNLRESSSARGDQNTPEGDIPVLLARRLNLRVILPFGSEPGKYQIEFRDNNDRLINKAEAQASISSGETSFKTAVDLSRNSAGDYTIGLRQQSFNWVRYRFQLR